MSRYNSYSGNGTGGNDNDYDDITLKLQKYSAIEVTGERVNAFETKWGDKLVLGFEDVNIIDGIVFRREDKHDTIKVFSPDKFFNVNHDDGLVYEKAQQDDEGNVTFENQMDAADIMEHPKILGFFEEFGGDEYNYDLVGVCLESAGDIAFNDDIDNVEQDGNKIVLGKVSMLLANKSWVRTMAKFITAEGNDIITMEEDDNGDLQSCKDQSGWLTTLEPTLRDGIEGRKMELFVIEDTTTFPGDDEPTTWTVPILLDGKTGERITLDNEEDESESSKPAKQSEPSEPSEPSDPAQAATDGGTATQTTSTPSTETTETPAEPSTDDTDEQGWGEGVDELIDYFGRTDGEVSAAELREFAEDEVDDPDDIDWESAAAQAKIRADNGEYQ